MPDAATPASEPKDDWGDQLAARLAGRAGHPDLLSPRLRGQLLRLARDIAHGSERKNAPLATFIAGRYVEARQTQGIDAETALGEITREVAAMLRNDPAATP
jgi:Domain of unknown function (DUF6457)